MIIDSGNYHTVSPTARGSTYKAESAVTSFKPFYPETTTVVDAEFAGGYLQPDIAAIFCNLFLMMYASGGFRAVRTVSRSRLWLLGVARLFIFWD